MLRLPFPWVTARRSCVRSFASDVFNLPTSPPGQQSDTLERLLEVEKPQTSSSLSWGNSTADSGDESLRDPPSGPLPRGGQPQANQQKFALPEAGRWYHLHVFSSRNNTILTFTDPIRNPIAWFSAGRCGFKNVQRSGYEAGYQCAVNMFKRIAEERKQTPSPMKLEISFKGFGFGREALYRALMTTEGDGIRDAVARFKDTTPIKIGGTRAKKTRRL